MKPLIANTTNIASLNTAGRGGQGFECALKFLLQKGFFDPLLDKIPGKALIEVPITNDVKIRIDGHGF